MGLEGKEDWKEGRESRTFSLQRRFSIVKSKQESSFFLENQISKYGNRDPTPHSASGATGI